MPVRPSAVCRALFVPAALAAAMALLPADTAAAPPDAAARAVLDRYLTATGGADAWVADSTMHTRISLSAFGLEGHADHWAARPDRVATVTQLGPLTLREGARGAVAWRVDQNGKLVWLDGLELEEARAGAYFEQEMWLAPDQGGGTVRHAGRESADGRDLEVLEIAPPVGKPRRLYFDAESGLLVKAVQTGDSQTLETTLSDYQEIAGRRRARSAVTRMAAMPGNDIRTRIDSLRVGVRVDSSLFLPPRQEVRDYRFLDGGSSAVLPMAYRARHVWLEASVDGHPPAEFVLDTGASITVIDSAYAESIGLATEGELTGAGAGAHGRFRFTRLSTLRAMGSAGEGVEVSGQNVLVAALDPYLEPAFWRPCAGVLGYDFISRFVLTVDFDERKVVLAEPAGFVYPGAGAALPIRFSGGVPVVTATLDGAYEGEFRLDVGSGSGIDLHTPFAEKHDLEEKAARVAFDQGGGFGGTWERAAIRMKSLRLGPHVVRGPVVHLSKARAGAMASSDYAGNIGNRILDRFNCTFDYGRKTLYLEPGRRFGEPDRYERFGAQLAKTDAGILVGHVIPGSSASEAGLAVGDEIISIAGRPPEDYGVDGLDEFFRAQPEGAVVDLEYRRGGQTQKVQMKLKNLL